MEGGGWRMPLQENSFSLLCKIFPHRREHMVRILELLLRVLTKWSFSMLNKRYDMLEDDMDFCCFHNFKDPVAGKKLGNLLLVVCL